MVRQLDPERRSSRTEVLKSRFALRVIGQPKATEALTAVIEKFNSGFYDHTKPIGSLLFLGPTGSGKTRVAEAFAEGLFGSATKMMVVDCAEFQHSHEIAKLVGSPPGYLGHRETHPFFTNASVRAARCTEETVPKELQPFTIILFDEIEKASDALWALLLGILDKGRLHTGTNEEVNMKPTIIIMTSNVGASDIAEDNSIGYSNGVKQYSENQMNEIVMSAARHKFMPEFLNRLDEIVMFKALTETEAEAVLKLELDALWDRIAVHSVIPFDFEVSPAGFKELLREGFSRRDNARKLKRTIEKFITLPIGRMVSTGQVFPNNLIICDYAEDMWKYYAQETKFVNNAKGRLGVPPLQQSTHA